MVTSEVVPDLVGAPVSVELVANSLCHFLLLQGLCSTLSNGTARLWLCCGEWGIGSLLGPGGFSATSKDSSSSTPNFKVGSLFRSHSHSRSHSLS